MNLLSLLEHTFLAGGFTTRSDMARENAELVAEASFRGLITTLTPRDGFGSVWRLTPNGLRHVPFSQPEAITNLEVPPDATIN